MGVGRKALATRRSGAVAEHTCFGSFGGAVVVGLGGVDVALGD